MKGFKLFRAEGARSVVLRCCPLLLAAALCASSCVSSKKSSASGSADGEYSGAEIHSAEKRPRLAIAAEQENFFVGRVCLVSLYDGDVQIPPDDAEWGSGDETKVKMKSYKGRASVYSACALCLEEGIAEITATYKGTTVKKKISVRPAPPQSDLKIVFPKDADFSAGRVVYGRAENAAGQNVTLNCHWGVWTGGATDVRLIDDNCAVYCLKAGSDYLVSECGDIVFETLRVLPAKENFYIQIPEGTNFKPKERVRPSVFYDGKDVSADAVWMIGADDSKIADFTKNPGEIVFNFAGEFYIKAKYNDEMTFARVSVAGD